MWNKLINLYCRQTPEQAVEPVQTEDMDVSKYYTFVAVHCFAGFYPQFVKAPSGAKMHVIDIDKFMLQANTCAAYWTSANWRYGYFQVFYICAFTLSCWRLNKICKGHISGRYPSNVIKKYYVEGKRLSRLLNLCNLKIWMVPGTVHSCLYIILLASIHNF